MYNLRPYQLDLKAQVYNRWSDGARNVVMVLPTGGGKSKLLGSIHLEHQGASAVIAHRKELVSQLSMTLAEAEQRHDIIAAKTTVRSIVQAQLAKYGRSFYQPQALTRVASIDTFIGAKNLDAWLAQVTLWTTDEGHHVVENNKWHTGIKRFTNPDVRGLLPTATPVRADGKGLGRHASGIADALVEGPPMRWLIEQGYLTDYQIVLAASNLEMLQTDIGSDGDYTPAKLKAAAQKSQIVGDVVKAYGEFTPGKLGIIFTTDVATANSTTAAFRAKGVRAETLTGDTDDTYRVNLIRRMETGDTIDVLVVVDVVSEGTDIPAVQMGTFGRPSESLQVYMQQFGRLLRPMYAPGYDLNTQAGRLAAIANGPKPIATVIDQVGNWNRHGPPDKARIWSLDDRDRRRSGDGIPMRICGAGWRDEALALEAIRSLDTRWLGGRCFREYERFYSECPHCYCPVPPPEPSPRSGPEQVDGDLVLMDRETLDKLRGEVEAATMSLEQYKVWLATRNMPSKGEMGAANRHAERLATHGPLQAAIEAFGGPLHAAGRDDRSIQREFYLRFKVDVLTARTLTAKETTTLTNKIMEYVNNG